MPRPRICRYLKYSLTKLPCVSIKYLVQMVVSIIEHFISSKYPWFLTILVTYGLAFAAGDISKEGLLSKDDSIFIANYVQMLAIVTYIASNVNVDVIELTNEQIGCILEATQPSKGMSNIHFLRYLFRYHLCYV